MECSDEHLTQFRRVRWSGEGGLEEIPPIDGWEFGRPLGRGAAGYVWSARRVGRDDEFAIKVLSADAPPAVQSCFASEVRALRLDHPRIVPLCDYGATVCGRKWLAMPRFEGGSLSRWRGRLPWTVLDGMARDVLGGLAHAHANDIHRDLKPGNLLLTSTDMVTARVSIADFGVAMPLDLADAEAIPGFAGTPAYMAPEQVEHRIRDQGPWTDLYALGCVLWDLLVGAPPFGREPGPALDGHLAPERPVLPMGLVPDEVADWLARCLKIEPAERFGSAAVALAALPAIASSVPRTPAVARANDEDDLTLSRFGDASGPPTRLIWKRSGSSVSSGAHCGYIRCSTSVCSTSRPVTGRVRVLVSIASLVRLKSDARSSSVAPGSRRRFA